MGDLKANILTPFQMTYVYDIPDEWGDEPWNATTKMCSEPYDVSVRGINASGLSCERIYEVY